MRRTPAGASTPLPVVRFLHCGASTKLLGSSKSRSGAGKPGGLWGSSLRAMEVLRFRPVMLLEVVLGRVTLTLLSGLPGSLRFCTLSLVGGLDIEPWCPLLEDDPNLASMSDFSGLFDRTVALRVGLVSSRKAFGTKDFPPDVPGLSSTPLGFCGYAAPSRPFPSENGASFNGGCTFWCTSPWRCGYESPSNPVAVKGALFEVVDSGVFALY